MGIALAEDVAGDDEEIVGDGFFHEAATSVRARCFSPEVESAIGRCELKVVSEDANHEIPFHAVFFNVGAKGHLRACEGGELGDGGSADETILLHHRSARF